jgi:predicted metalloprotease with PDZ domain
VWVTEGLPEYYSLALQLRSGLIRERDFERGLRLFERYGDWHVNLTDGANLAATNNSAPLVVYAIDRAIRQDTDGVRSLDDVVSQLAEQKGKLSTASFLRAVNAVSGRNFTSFFRRHVYAGIPPKLDGFGRGPAVRGAEPSSPKRKSTPTGSEDVSNREVDLAD